MSGVLDDGDNRLTGIWSPLLVRMFPPITTKYGHVDSVRVKKSPL